MSKVKFRIVKKEKDGVLLSGRKGAKPEKLGWDEFHKYYTVEDKVWAIPSEELVNKMKEVNEHAENAAVAYFMSGSAKGECTDMAQMLLLGQETEKIQKLLNCTPLEAMQLIKSKIDMIYSFGGDSEPKQHHHKKNKKKSDISNKTAEVHTGNSLGDNPALIALRKQMEK